MKQRNKFLIVVLSLILVAGMYLLTTRQPLVAEQDQTKELTIITSPVPAFPDRSIVPITLGEKTLSVEVVNSPESMTLGLSGRDTIGADGMLFIFPQRGIPRFWMKDMRFDLDMVWIDGNRVIDISKNVPKPAENVVLLPKYSPKSPASLVLEIPAGKVEEWGIVEGARFSFSQL